MTCVFVTDRLDVAAAIVAAGLRYVLLVPPDEPIEAEIEADLVVWVECRTRAAREWRRTAHRASGWCPDDDEPYPERTPDEIVAGVLADLEDWADWEVIDA